jgi:hypothetical protein
MCTRLTIEVPHTAYFRVLTTNAATEYDVYMNCSHVKLFSSWMEWRGIILYIMTEATCNDYDHEGSQSKLFCSRMQSGWMHECSQTKFFLLKFIQGKLLCIWKLRCKLILFIKVVKRIYSVHEFIQVELFFISMEPRQMILVFFWGGGNILFIIVAANIRFLFMTLATSDFLHVLMQSHQIIFFVN